MVLNKLTKKKHNSKIKNKSIKNRVKTIKMRGGMWPRLSKIFHRKVRKTHHVPQNIQHSKSTIYSNRLPISPQSVIEAFQRKGNKYATPLRDPVPETPEQIKTRGEQEILKKTPLPPEDLDRIEVIKNLMRLEHGMQPTDPMHLNISRWHTKPGEVLPQNVKINSNIIKNKEAEIRAKLEKMGIGHGHIS